MSSPIICCDQGKFTENSVLFAQLISEVEHDDLTFILMVILILLDVIIAAIVIYKIILLYRARNEDANDENDDEIAAII